MSRGGAIFLTVAVGAGVVALLVYNRPRTPPVLTLGQLMAGASYTNGAYNDDPCGGYSRRDCGGVPGPFSDGAYGKGDPKRLA